MPTSFWHCINNLLPQFSSQRLKLLKSQILIKKTDTINIHFKTLINIPSCVVYYTFSWPSKTKKYIYRNIKWKMSLPQWRDSSYELDSLWYLGLELKVFPQRNWGILWTLDSFLLAVHSRPLCSCPHLNYCPGQQWSWHYWTGEQNENK